MRHPSSGSNLSPLQSPKKVRKNYNHNSMASLSEVNAYRQGRTGDLQCSLSSLKSFLPSDRPFVKITYAKNEYYEGTVNDLFIPDGQGCFYFSNGDQYSGDVVNGVKKGYGKYTYNDGAFYIGNWNDNQKQGEGEFVSVNNGWRYIGQFDKDIPISGNFVDDYEDNNDNISMRFDIYDEGSENEMNVNVDTLEEGYEDLTRISLKSLKESFDLKTLTPIKTLCNEKNIDSASTVDDNDVYKGVKPFNMNS